MLNLLKRFLVVIFVCVTAVAFASAGINSEMRSRFKLARKAALTDLKPERIWKCFYSLVDQEDVGMLTAVYIQGVEDDSMELKSNHGEGNSIYRVRNGELVGDTTDPDIVTFVRVNNQGNLIIENATTDAEWAKGAPRSLADKSRFGYQYEVCIPLKSLITTLLK